MILIILNENYIILVFFFIWILIDIKKKYKIFILMSENFMRKYKEEKCMDDEKKFFYFIGFCYIVKIVI